MIEPEIPLPVTCPHCGEKSLAKFRVSVLADGILGDSIRLYADCHLVAWDASEGELENIRHHLRAAFETCEAV
jgi:DNA-directed RNA polymerase subunit RPC12/RpoP